uniref:B box-type domain-containing protein n=1 Tax=Erpetoichthys calabaricus TaxID=27687 RepID=A0A8C4XIF6_ERPCA
MEEQVENLEEMDADATLSQSYAGPGDVFCDVCPGKRRKASKTCLTCMVSYCKTHLQHHQESEALMRHKLEELTENTEEKHCKEHQEFLELFCRTDDICICLVCATTEHKSHDTVTSSEERHGRQSQLDSKKNEVKKKIEEKEKKLEEMKEAVKRIEVSCMCLLHTLWK